MQTELIRHVAGTAVATTYQTGAIARMGEAVSRVVSRTARCARSARSRCAVSPGEWRWSMALAAAVVAALAPVWFAAPAVFVTSHEDD